MAADDPFETPEGIHEDEAGVKRDRWGRYVIPDPETGVEQSWTRATTFAKSITDSGGLQRWAERMVAKGMALRPDLVTLASATPLEDRGTLDQVAEQAKTTAGSKTAAHYGTALHLFTEMMDKGEQPEVPEPWATRIRAYHAALKAHQIEVVQDWVERVVILKEFGIAGTFDRIVRMPSGELWIADLKGLALGTPLPTPTGWTTMDKVQVDDRVLGANGSPCRVTAKSGIKRIGTYVVRFDDGAEVICDSEHLWQTTIGYGKQARTAVRGVEEIAGSIYSRKGQAQHRVPVSAPLDLDAADLPIDPYLLGCWLGDGAARGGSITKAADLFEVLAEDGHQFGVEQVDARRPHVITRTVLGLTTALRTERLLYDKHIPEPYLRGSFQQRLRLLQGLMDTDGTWNTARRTAVFSTTNQRLADQVEELCLTLGQRPHVAFFRRAGFGLTVDSWTVGITPVGIYPFRLPRKMNQVDARPKNTFHARRRVIVEVRPGPDVETACIAVDSPDHLYLAGRHMIPTHNTGRALDYAWNEIAVQLALYAHADAIFNYHTGSFERMPVVSRERGLIMHLPIEGDTCHLYEVDLEMGWRAAELCNRVRNWRKYRGLATLIDSATVTAPNGGAVVTLSWPDRIAAAESIDDLTDIWLAAKAAGQWSDVLEQLGIKRRDEIVAAEPESA